MQLDSNARYQESHEWAKKEGDLIVIGISDYAQDSLNDVVYVEHPAVGSTLEKGEIFGVVESVKAASDLYMPISGEIAAVNEALEDTPELVNDDPYGEGWFIKIKPSNPADFEALLTPEAYQASIQE